MIISKMLKMHLIEFISFLIKTVRKSNRLKQLKYVKSLEKEVENNVNKLFPYFSQQCVNRYHLILINGDIEI